MILTLVVVTAGAWTLLSQVRADLQRRAATPGTIRWEVERSEPDKVVTLQVDVEYPTFKDIDSLTDASDAVVQGKVVGSAAVICDRDRFICTQNRVKVSEVLSGSVTEDKRGTDNIPVPQQGGGMPPVFPGPAADEITITQLGGQLRIEGRLVIAKSTNEPLLRKGKEYILFLSWLPGSRKTNVGSNTYVLTAGPQAAIQLDGDEAHSMVWRSDAGHPIRFDVESLLKGNKELIRSHIESRRLGRRP